MSTYIPSFLCFKVGPVAQSLQRLATGWTVRGWNPGVRRDFPHLSRPALGPHPVSCTTGTGPFPGVKNDQGVTLTPHPLLVQWSWKGRATSLLHLWAVRPVQNLSACTRVTFTFFCFSCNVRTRNLKKDTKSVDVVHISNNRTPKQKCLTQIAKKSVCFHRMALNSLGTWGNITSMQLRVPLCSTLLACSDVMFVHRQDTLDCSSQKIVICSTKNNIDTWYINEQIPGSHKN